MFGKCFLVDPGSPLLDLSKVIKLQSVQGLISLPLTILAATCSGLWTLLGFQLNDYNVIIPNLIGCVLCVVQLFIFAYYRKNSNRDTVYLPVVKHEKE